MNRTDVFPPGPTNRREILVRFQEPLKFLVEIMETYGEMAYMKIGARDTYVVSDPDLIQRIFVEEPDKFDKPDHTKDVFSPIGQGMLIASGNHHKRHRRTLQPLFTPTWVAEYADIAITHTLRLVNTWQSGQMRNLEADMTGLTMSIIADAIFGIQAEELRAELSDAVSTLHRYTADTLGRNRLTPELKIEWQAAGAILDRIVRNVLVQYKPSNSRDFLSLMQNAVDPESGQGMSEQEIRDEALTLLIAGHETTANALTWIWYLLAKHPDIEAEVFAEVQHVVGDRTITYDDLSKLQSMALVFKEALRMYPPAWLIGRKALEPVELGGYIVPTNAVMVVPIYAMHRNSKYFPEPDVFKPERFLTEPKKYSYIPFGTGPRVCLGQHFATMEALLVLASIVQRYQFRFPANYVAIHEGLASLKPKLGPMVEVIDR